MGGALVKNYLNKYQYRIPNPTILKSPFCFKKVDGRRSLLKKYEEFDLYCPKDRNEKVVKQICVHILYAFAYNISSLEDTYLKECSEQTILIR
ncbi:hypothetical protein BD408DRAFT_41126 [Parasitella parasitica]|nr:hypothetical protein BD408DRAFT_41126 [Parasitella parasitica]